MNETLLQSKLNDPVSVLNAKGNFDFTEILSKYVLNGSEYELWDVDEEKQQALFFQKVKDNPIYFSRNAMLTIHWNEEGEVTNYEQSMLGEFGSFNRKKDLLSPIEAIGNLYSRGHLKQDSKCKAYDTRLFDTCSSNGNPSVCPDMACSCRIEGWGN